MRRRRQVTTCSAEGRGLGQQGAVCVLPSMSTLPPLVKPPLLLMRRGHTCKSPPSKRILMRGHPADAAAQLASRALVWRWRPTPPQPPLCAAAAGGCMAWARADASLAAAAAAPCVSGSGSRGCPACGQESAVRAVLLLARIRPSPSAQLLCFRPVRKKEPSIPPDAAAIGWNRVRSVVGQLSSPAARAREAAMTTVGAPSPPPPPAAPSSASLPRMGKQ